MTKQQKAGDPGKDHPQTYFCRQTREASNQFDTQKPPKVLPLPPDKRESLRKKIGKMCASLGRAWVRGPWGVPPLARRSLPVERAGVPGRRSATAYRPAVHLSPRLAIAGLVCLIQASPSPAPTTDEGQAFRLKGELVIAGALTAALNPMNATGRDA